MEYVFRSAERHYSPIWVRTVEPQKSGEGLLTLDFFHANYAEGTRDKVYRLKIVHRAEGYLLALSKDDAGEVHGTVILEPITATWMNQRCPEEGRQIRKDFPFADELGRITARSRL